MFVTYKRKGEAPLSGDPDTKRIHHWERMQTGFDAAKLKIQRNHRVRKKCALDALHATDKYKSMSSAEREQADTKVITDCETRRNVDFAAAAHQPGLNFTSSSAQLLNQKGRGQIVPKQFKIAHLAQQKLEAFQPEKSL